MQVPADIIGGLTETIMYKVALQVVQLVVTSHPGEDMAQQTIRLLFESEDAIRRIISVGLIPEDMPFDYIFGPTSELRGRLGGLNGLVEKCYADPTATGIFLAVGNRDHHRVFAGTIAEVTRRAL
jgi:hypothetical protein